MSGELEKGWEAFRKALKMDERDKRAVTCMKMAFFAGCLVSSQQAVLGECADDLLTEAELQCERVAMDTLGRG